MTTTITLNERELAHILAALRMAQNGSDYELFKAAPQFEGIEGGPLHDDEVGSLCERINVKDAAQHKISPEFTINADIDIPGYVKHSGQGNWERITAIPPPEKQKGD